MATKKVTVTLTRTYSKSTTIEVEVDENLVGEELQDFLTTDDAIDTRLEDGIFEASLDGGDDEYEYSDPTNSDGGHL
jgi:hypothetical protein